MATRRIDQQAPRGRLRHGEPMARHCSWRVGGTAEHYFEPADLDDLRQYISSVDDGEPITWLGLGSNVLVRDGGITGHVIATSPSLNELRWLSPTQLMVACGVPCAKIAREAAQHGCAGAAFLAGIPGSIGGALAMNAGAFGGEVWRLVESVELMTRDGQVQRQAAEKFTVSYRQVDLAKDHWFVACVLIFEATDRQDSAEIRELLAQRGAAQPTGQASSGSVFKNPPGDFAGRLIEAAGLKGKRIGGCHVSTKHANFIINDDSASAADIETLISLVQRAVRVDSGIELEPEVRIIGQARSNAEPIR